MTKRSDERTDFLASVLTTAIEGGIDYWADVRSYKHNHEEPKPFRSSAVLREGDPELGVGIPWTTVNEDTIAHGIAVVKRSGFQISPDILSDILTSDKDNDGSDIDATAADCILQAALFNEIVYG